MKRILPLLLLTLLMGGCSADKRIEAVGNYHIDKYKNIYDSENSIIYYDKNKMRWYKK